MLQEGRHIIEWSTALPWWLRGRKVQAQAADTPHVCGHLAADFSTNLVSNKRWWEGMEECERLWLLVWVMFWSFFSSVPSPLSHSPRPLLRLSYRFRRHVVGRATDDIATALGAPPCLGHNARCRSKVGKLANAVLVNQHVGRLQVPQTTTPPHKENGDVSGASSSPTAAAAATAAATTTHTVP